MMSNKGTPTTKRLYNVTPNSRLVKGLVRKHVLKSQEQTGSRTSLTELETSMEAQALNTAFCRTQNSGTPRFKPKPTVLNACYTPSSLYRSANSTPNRTGTPIAQKRNVHATKTKAEAEESSTEMSNLKVAVRVRPLNTQECTRSNVTNVVRVQDNELTVLAGSTADYSAGVSHSFAYDHVFYSCNPESSRYAAQEDVFAGTALPLIERAFEGYNACLFAYGQTGSGKSYSMMGMDALDEDSQKPHAESGIIPRFCYELFRRAEVVKHQFQAEIEVSYFEIYNEKIHDLLSVAPGEFNCGSSTNISAPLQHRQALKVREHPIWGPYVVDLSVHPVDSYESLRNWLAVGNSQRATAATGMNDKSSRSHSIFNIVLNLTELEGSTPENSDTDEAAQQKPLRQMRRSKISLVDLAGSERISASGSNGDRMREGVSINKSLLTLGKVISALADTKNSTFVPYRESVLTWLLRENLGGNSRTVMLATISPASCHVDETLATLRYACQARTIVNRVKVNESPHDRIIRELRAEVDRLKSLHNEYERQRRLSGNTKTTPRKIIIETTTTVDDSQVESLRQQLAERERELNRAQKSWMERLKDAEDQRKSELRLLKRKGLALELSADQKQACLVNLTADPILSGTLFYILPPGVVRIGRPRSGAKANGQPDIMLEGPLVAHQHCTIEHQNGQLYLTPDNAEFETYLNGELVLNRRQLFHGDRLVIGGSHYFRISNPFCTERHKNMIVDFQLAHQEILDKQEKKLRLELEEEKHAALSRIESERVENERIFKEQLQKLELEQLKFKCKSEIFETERKASKENSLNTETMFDTSVYTPSHKSTLLEDIKRIMHNPSEESLHRTQLKVREATQRCRSVGLQYEFRQSQVGDEFGMFRTVVLILDRANQRKAEWPPARLDVWLDIVRDADCKLNSDNILKCVDVNWEPLEQDLNDTLNDSGSSRIALNLSCIKDALLNKTLQKSPKILTASQQAFNRTKKMLTYDVEPATPSALKRLAPFSPQKHPHPHASADPAAFSLQATQHVRDMQRSALLLKKLCMRQQDNQENLPRNLELEQSIQESVVHLESMLQQMRATLEHSAAIESVKASPSKTPKCVRFLID